MNTKLLIALLVVGLNMPNVSASDAGRVYVSSEKDNRIYVFDSESYISDGYIETGERPRAISFNKDKTQIFVATSNSDLIEIVDIASREVVDELEVGEDPEMFDFSADGNSIYTTLEEDGLLSIFNLKDRSTVSVEVGEEPEGVLTHPNGSLVYVTSEEANLVHVVEVEKLEILANITVGNRPRRFGLSTQLNELWVSNEMSGSVSVIDTTSNEITETLEFLPKGFRKPDVTPVGLALDEANDRAYVGLGRANHVAVVELSTKQILDYVLVGNRAWGLTLDAGRSRLLVANGLSDDMSVIDTRSNKVIKTVPVGRVPYGILISD